MNWNITAHCFPACWPSEPKTFQVCIQTPAKVPHLLFLVTLPMGFSHPPPKRGNCFPEWHNAQTAFPQTDRKGLRVWVWISGDQSCHSLLHDLGQINQPPCHSVSISSNENVKAPNLSFLSPGVSFPVRCLQKRWAQSLVTQAWHESTESNEVEDLTSIW